MRRGTRRSFIQSASLAAAGNAMGLQPFGTWSALAQSKGGYKALVCIFLYGGNDANNMLVPFDQAGYAAYAAARGPLAIPQAQLLPFEQLPSFSLHPALTGLRSLFDGKSAALVANVGTLVSPLTKLAYEAGASQPSALFSHADQQLEWQNVAADGATSTGWGGRVSDLLGPIYNSSASVPMIASTAGDTLFCDGETSAPYAVTSTNLGTAWCNEGRGECAAQTSVAQELLSLQSGEQLVQLDDAMTSKAYGYTNTLSQAIAGVPPLRTAFPANNPLAAQLQQIARLIQMRSTLGLQRQIFFAGLNGFDTHAGQLEVHSALLGQLSTALVAFNQAMEELSLGSSVTTFTMSDFARTLQPNSNTGSDHAWGSHHIVTGGAVKGGKLYGTFPTLALGGPDDSASSGRWIPSTGSVQYAATLASWFGVSQAQMSAIFPTLSAFKQSNLGFV